MNEVQCEICGKLFDFDGTYRMGALVCIECDTKNKEYLDEYWNGSITGQLKEKEIVSVNQLLEGQLL